MDRCYLESGGGLQRPNSLLVKDSQLDEYRNWSIQMIVLVEVPLPVWFETCREEDVATVLDAENARENARYVFYVWLVDDAQICTSVSIASMS